MSAVAPPAFTFKAPQTALYEVAIKTVTGGITPKRIGEESNAVRSQLVAANREEPRAQRAPHTQGPE